MEKHICKNGVRIIFENIPTVRSVAIGLWMKTGSRNESPDINGVSHFIEHMFFKGTTTRTAKEIAECFDGIGGQVNAFTSKEYTCYYAKVLDNHSQFALEVLADMFFNSTFLDEEMTKEKQVVYEEIKMYEDTPDDMVHDLLGRAIYGQNALGYPILGSQDTLSSFTPDTLRKYISSCYTPDKMVISIAGNVDAAFIKEVEKIFGEFTREKGKCEIELPGFNFGHIYKAKDTEQAHLLIGYEGFKHGHEDLYSLTIMNNILGGSMSSRLFQEVREQRGLAYSTFSYQSSFVDTGVVALYGGTGVDRVEELFETMKATVDTIRKEGITERELTNTKEQLKGNMMLALESTNSRMTRNGKNEMLLGYHRSLDEVIELIDAVTQESVHEVAQKIFTDDFASALISPKELTIK